MVDACCETDVTSANFDFDKAFLSEKYKIITKPSPTRADSSKKRKTLAILGSQPTERPIEQSKSVTKLERTPKASMGGDRKGLGYFGQAAQDAIQKGLEEPTNNNFFQSQVIGIPDNISPVFNLEKETFESPHPAGVADKSLELESGDEKAERHKQAIPNQRRDADLDEDSLSSGKNTTPENLISLNGNFPATLKRAKLENPKERSEQENSKAKKKVNLKKMSNSFEDFEVKKSSEKQGEVKDSISKKDKQSDGQQHPAEEPIVDTSINKHILQKKPHGLFIKVGSVCEKDKSFCKIT
jgi:hypothetical protein